MAFKFDMENCFGTTSAMQRGITIRLPKFVTTKDQFIKKSRIYMDNVQNAYGNIEKKKKFMELYRYFGETDYKWETDKELYRTAIQKLETIAETQPREYVDMLKGFISNRIAPVTNENVGVISPPMKCLYQHDHDSGCWPTPKFPTQDEYNKNKNHIASVTNENVGVISPPMKCLYQHDHDSGCWPTPKFPTQDEYNKNKNHIASVTGENDHHNSVYLTPLEKVQFDKEVRVYMNNVEAVYKKSEKKEICIELFKYLGETDYAWETDETFRHAVINKLEEFAKTEPQEYIDTLKGLISSHI